jgi:hypothetical protein
MFKRMTVRAKNFEITNLVVVPISVFVMNAKNAWLGVIFAPLTIGKHVATNHSFTNCAKLRFKTFFLSFVNAGPAAKLSFFRWAGIKYRFAMRAFYNDAAFCVHSLIIAFARAIFGLIGAGSNMRKRRVAYRTGRSHFNASRKGKAFARAVFGSISTIFRYIKNRATMLASDMHGGSYAVG